ncbi:MAG TPA: DoxX family protein [Candidatus Hydrogenedentes bacterium]|nr:DoxX family protein [Candidatus Hydrogenedentota bacterium]HQM50853.1 DoxX family protein [Candidatus Hydrogenedentota bacterium]
MALKESGKPQSRFALSAVSMWAFSILRIAVGWHFLYEGVVKLADPGWTSAWYLQSSQWVLADVFKWVAETPAALQVVDFLNMWGLVFIGLGLIFGFFTRLAGLAAIVLLGLYYAANPSLITLTPRGAEGNYLFIDKNLVELFALLALMFVPTGKFMGIDGLIANLRAKRREKREAGDSGRALDELDAVPRRAWLRHFATVPVAGGFALAFGKKHGWPSFEEQHLLAKTGGIDGLTSATMKKFEFAKLEDLKGAIPHGKIQNLELSRMILGGNLMGGWAHARDLIYVSQLVKSYHSRDKIFETFRIAEQCGINTILTNPILSQVINDYWKYEGGKIQFMSDCALGGDVVAGIKMSIDGGAHSCYVQGGIADNLVKEGKVDQIAEAFELIRQSGIPAGIGAHKMETVKACVEYGLKPDYWMKTLHHIDYWSARPQEQCDNIWCENPVETAAYMETLEQPWIAFKTLAAGAIHPTVGLPFAFKHGADFVCVGMYDFQLVENTNLFLDVWGKRDEGRTRPWRV